jgi:hypothetical protein
MTVCVTTAADREPYLGMARALGAELRALGPQGPEVLLVEHDPWPEGPYIGKRRPLAAALRSYLDRGEEASVWWCDADHVVRNRAALSRLFVELPREGLWVSAQGDLLGDGEERYLASLPDVGGPALIRWCARLLEVRRAVRVDDWLYGLRLGATKTRLLFEAWNTIAREVVRAGQGFHDGVALGLAAAAAGVSIFVDPGLRDRQASALWHRHNGTGTAAPVWSFAGEVFR